MMMSRQLASEQCESLLNSFKMPGNLTTGLPGPSNESEERKNPTSIRYLT
jgi:hypothetical protein